jgi:CBS domain-containing protein
MTSSDRPVGPGCQLAPRFEHARVDDVMRHGIISCDPEAGLRAVARIMASYHVHAVVVGLGGDVWGMITAADLLAAAGTDRERLSAGEIAATDFATVNADARLDEAVGVMRRHGTDHIVVTDDSGKPLGMVSSLDVAGCLAWGEG